MSEDHSAQLTRGMGRLAGGIGGGVIGGGVGAGIGGLVNYFRKDKKERNWKDTAKGMLAGGAIGTGTGALYYGHKGGKAMQNIHEHAMRNDPGYRADAEQFNREVSKLTKNGSQCIGFGLRNIL